MRYDDRSTELRALEYLEAAGSADPAEVSRWTEMDEDDIYEAFYRLDEEGVVFEYGGEVIRSWRVPDPSDVRGLLSDRETAELYGFIRENDDAEHPRYGFSGVPLTGIFHDQGIDAVRNPFVAEEGEEKIAIYDRLRELESAGLIERKGFNALYGGSEPEEDDGLFAWLRDRFLSGSEEDSRFMDDWGHAGAFYTAAELPDVYEELVAELV